MKTSLSEKLAGAMLASMLAAAGCSGGEKDAASQSPEPQSAAPSENAEAFEPASPAPIPATELQSEAHETGAAGDAARGKRVFVKCMGCHSTAQGKIVSGPPLYKIVGAPAGKAAGDFGPQETPAATFTGVLRNTSVSPPIRSNPMAS